MDTIHYFYYENSREAVKAVNVQALDNYFIEVSFSNGKIKTYDVKPLLNKDAFTSLKNKEAFSNVKIMYNTVFWDINKGIDLDASVLYWEGVEEI